MANVYGWRKDPRFRAEPDGTNTDLVALDKKFETLSTGLNFQLGSGDVNLSQYCVAMDQYQLSSCTGNATCESLEMLENMVNGNAVLLSRLFTYGMARTIEGTLNVDGGSHVRTCFDTLSRFGVCTETIWPYDMNQVNVSPSILAQQQAVGHKIKGYYRITSTGEQRLQDIQTALYNKHPIVIGTDVGTDFENLPQGTLGPLGPPALGTIKGGHALVIVGYVGGNYIIKNSWGTGWGQNGFCMFTPDYLTWTDTDDLWVPTLAPVFTS
jgi:C1A family cysteine protease